jgi:hypothetical protein
MYQCNAMCTRPGRELKLKSKSTEHSHTMLLTHIVKHNLKHSTLVLHLWNASGLSSNQRSRSWCLALAALSHSELLTIVCNYQSL